MRVAITGSSGFLGSAIVRYFSNHNSEIICLIRSKHGKADSENISFVEYKESLFTEDVTSKLAKLNPDVFIHCAWKGTAGEYRNEPFQQSYNLPLTLESVHLAHASGCKQWIGTGSQAEYGVKTHVISETESTIPLTNYGKAKLSAGSQALELCTQLGIRGAWNRIFSLYGPGDNINYFIPYVINSLLQKSLPEVTKCEQQWDYLYVDDAADAFYSQCIKQCSGLYNLCSGNTVTLKSTIEMIQKLLSDNSEIQYGIVPYSENQIMFLAGDCRRLKEQTGWTPRTSLAEGLKQTINYYRKLESN